MIECWASAIHQSNVIHFSRYSTTPRKQTKLPLWLYTFFFTQMLHVFFYSGVWRYNIYLFRMCMCTATLFRNTKKKSAWCIMNSNNIIIINETVNRDDDFRMGFYCIFYFHFYLFLSSLIRSICSTIDYVVSFVLNCRIPRNSFIVEHDLMCLENDNRFQKSLNSYTNCGRMLPMFDGPHNILTNFQIYQMQWEVNKTICVGCKAEIKCSRWSIWKCCDCKKTFVQQSFSFGGKRN